MMDDDTLEFEFKAKVSPDQLVKCHPGLGMAVTWGVSLIVNDPLPVVLPLPDPTVAVTLKSIKAKFAARVTGPTMASELLASVVPLVSELVEFASPVQPAKE